MKYAIQLISLILISLVAFSLDISIGDEGVKGVEISMVSESYAVSCGTPGAKSDTCIPTGGIDNLNKSVANLGNDNESKVIKEAVDLLNAILGVMTFIITPLIAFAGWLLSPDWTRGDLFGLNIGLYKIWVTISNVTYFIYALGLIGIALATIFNVENYTYKQLLPKLALGILIVPFTWWIVQAVLSVGNILTVAVMQIPIETLDSISVKNTEGDTWWTRPSIPKKITYRNTGNSNVSEIQKSAECNSNVGPIDPSKCLSVKQILTNASSGPYSMLTVYAYSIFQIQEFKSLSNTAITIKQILQIFNKVVFGAIIFLIFGLLMLALVFALLARAFELWILTMFSPLLSLSLVLPDSMKGESFKEHISFSNLITLAMIPVYVAGALSFGILILGLLMNGGEGSSSMKDYTAEGGGQGKQIAIFGGDVNNAQSSLLSIYTKPSTSNSTEKDLVTSFKLGEFTLESIGTVTNEQASDINGGKNFFSQSGGIIGTMIVNIIGLTLLWLALMGALKASKITASAIEPFEKAGKTIGDLGKSLPKYAPIPGTGGMSLSSMEKISKQPEYLLSKKAEERTNNSTLGKMFNMGNTMSQADEKQINERLQRNTKTDPEALRQIVGLLGNNQDKDIKYSDTPKAVMEKLGKDFNNSAASIESALKTAGVSDASAKTIALKTTQGKYDLKTDKDLERAFKNIRGGAGSAGANESININFGQKKVEGAENTFDIKIDGKEIQLKFNKDEKTIEKFDESKLKTIIEGKVGIITKEEFISKLNLPDDIEKGLIEKIVKANPKFFKEEPKKTPNKPDEPTSSTTPPPAPSTP